MGTRRLCSYLVNKLRMFYQVAKGAVRVALLFACLLVRPALCFYCVSSGEWIPIDWVCDAQSDCSDSSDEAYDLNCVYQKIFLKKGQESPWAAPTFGKRRGHYKTSFRQSTSSDETNSASTIRRILRGSQNPF